VAVKVAEVQNMARHVLRNELVLWLPGQHLNRPCKSGEATKATGKQKWPTLRNVGIRYRRFCAGVATHVAESGHRDIRSQDLKLPSLGRVGTRTRSINSECAQTCAVSSYGKLL
jgi:hypothetical protein